MLQALKRSVSPHRNGMYPPPIPKMVALVMKIVLFILPSIRYAPGGDVSLQVVMFEIV